MVKFCTHVDYVKSQQSGKNEHCKGRSLGHVTHFKFWGPTISLKRLKLESSNFAHRLNVSNPSLGWQTTFKRGVVGVAWSIFFFHARDHISGTAEARRQILYAGIVCHMLALRWHTYPIIFVVRVMRPFFVKFCPSIISLESVNVGTSNIVRWLIQRCTSAGMIDYSRKGCFQGLVTSLNFGK